MKILSVIFGLILLANIVLPFVSIAPAEAEKQVDPYISAVGVREVKDNNIDVEYTGKSWKDDKGTDWYEYTARIHQAPIYNDDGTPVDCAWHLTEAQPIYEEVFDEKSKIVGYSDAYYTIKDNVFSAQVTGSAITVTYQGQSMSWNPVVLVDSKEYAAKGSPKLLTVDPINENYLNNTLEWDYGVCVRRVRVIEGLIQETWTFASDPHGTVWIKDNMQKSKGFEWALEPYGYDADGNAIEVNSYKQVSAKVMAEAKYPVVIDPTEVFVTSASDGCTLGRGGSKALARDATLASGLLSTSQATYIGYWFSSPFHNVYRGYVFFDTSAIPDSATISAVNLSLYSQSLYLLGETVVPIVITNGMPTYPHDPIVAGDQDRTKYSGDGGRANASASGYFNISMNATGISWIDVTGTSKFQLQSGDDYDDTIGGYAALTWYNYEKGAGYRPYLEVTYDASGPPTVTTNPATYVTGTTARLNGYLNNDGGEACDVSFEYLEWYNASWSDVFAVTIDPANIDSDLTNFPVLVTGDGLPDNFWITVNSSGLDIVVTDSDLNKRPRELVSIDTTNESMELYFNASTIDDTNETHYYVWYGGVATETNNTSTWDTNYIAVWHMNDDPDTSHIADSTVNNQDGIKKGANEPVQATGLIADGLGYAQQFDGTDDYIEVAHNANQLLTTGATLSAVLKVATGGETAGRIISKESGTAGQDGYGYFTSSTNKIALLSSTVTYAGDNNGWVSNITTLASLTWNGEGAYQFYKDGNTWGSGSGLNTSAIDYTGVLRLGQISMATTRTLNSILDEVRISNVSRSAAWCKATYYSLMLPSTFYTIDDPSAYTTTTAQSKNTGQSWYDNITGLTKDKLYGYRATGSNGNGDDDGDWVLFSTEVTLGAPSNVLCSASSNSITLSWTKGGNTSQTYIRYKTGSYPTDSTDGNVLPVQSGVDYVHSGLISGTSYFYRMWGYDAGDLSATNSTTMCTTTAGYSEGTPVPLPTVDTSDWSGEPNGSVLENNPLYALGNLEADEVGVPHNTFWMLLGLGGLVVTGLFIYTRSRNLLAALGAMIIFGVLMAQMGLFPIWTMIIFGLTGIGFGWKEIR